MAAKLGIIKVANQSADVLYTWQGTRVFITNLDRNAYDLLRSSPRQSAPVTLDLGDGQEQRISITQINTDNYTKIIKCEAVRTA